MEEGVVKEICLDTETTGFYPKGGDRIVDIGCVELTKDGKISKDYFHEFIDPERNIPDDVIKVHGITNEMVQGKPTFAQIADKFIDYIKGARLIIHNAPFDVAFIDEELKRVGKGSLESLGCKVVDSLELAKKNFRDSITLWTPYVLALTWIFPCARSTGPILTQSFWLRCISSCVSLRRISGLIPWPAARINCIFPVMSAN